jgi:hypothetical protein
VSADVANGPNRTDPIVFERASSPARRLAPYALSVLGLSLLFTLGGAFDTDDLGFLRRWALWLTISGLIVGQTAVLDAAFARLTPRGGWPRAVASLAAIALMAPLMTLEISALKATPLTPSWWGHDPLLELGLFIAPTVLVAAAAVVLLRRPQVRRTLRIEALADQVDEILELSAPAIAGLLPPPRSAAFEHDKWPAAPVLSVEAHDHYLEVATASGTSFLRGRMRDATAKLRGADGLHVHRSWWVAREAVATVRRAGRDYILVLTSGAEVPIGRSRLSALRAEGWI